VLLHAKLSAVKYHNLKLNSIHFKLEKGSRVVSCGLQSHVAQRKWTDITKFRVREQTSMVHTSCYFDPESEGRVFLWNTDWLDSTEKLKPDSRKAVITSKVSSNSLFYLQSSSFHLLIVYFICNLFLFIFNLCEWVWSRIPCNARQSNLWLKVVLSKGNCPKEPVVTNPCCSIVPIQLDLWLLSFRIAN
jgi:hypothetical protein